MWQSYTKLYWRKIQLTVFYPAIGAVLCLQSSTTAMKLSSRTCCISVWQMGRISSTTNRLSQSALLGRKRGYMVRLCPTACQIWSRSFLALSSLLSGTSPPYHRSEDGRGRFGLAGHLTICTVP